MKSVAVLLFESVPLAQACSDVLVNVSDPNIVMSGRTMDFDVDLQSVIEVIPRNTTFQEPPVRGCASCPDYKWQNKYGFLAFNMFQLNVAADGLNEKGLSAAWLYLEDSTEYPTPDAAPSAKPIVTSIPSYLLGNFATVDEVKEGLKNIQLAEIDDRVEFVASVFPTNPQIQRWPLHVAVHDANGKSLVIEFLNGQAVVLDNPNGVLTNEPPLTEQLAGLKNATATGLPNGVSYESDARFLRLSLLNPLVAGGYVWSPPNSSFLVGSEAQSAVSASLHLLNTVVLPVEEATQWTLVRDHKAPAIYFQSTLNQQLRRLQLADFNLTSSASRQYIPVYEPASAWFEDASVAFKNQSQGKKTMDLPSRTQLEALIPANATWPPEESQVGSDDNSGNMRSDADGVRAAGWMALVVAAGAALVAP